MESHQGLGDDKALEGLKQKRFHIHIYEIFIYIYLHVWFFFLKHRGLWLQY